MADKIAGNSDIQKQSDALLTIENDAIVHVPGDWQKIIGGHFESLAKQDPRNNIYYDSKNVTLKFDCHTIKIGSYSLTPQDKGKKVIINSNIRIVAPHLQDTAKDVILNIPINEIIRILYYPGEETFPMIFIYCLHKTGVNIQKELGMLRDSGPYYDPISRINPHKRITLLPDTVSADMEAAFHTMFAKKLEVLSHREAVNVYFMTCYKMTNDESRSIVYCSSSETSSSPSPRLTSSPNPDDDKNNKLVISNIRHQPEDPDPSFSHKSKRRRLGKANEDTDQLSLVSQSGPCRNELNIVITTEPFKTLSMEQANKIQKCLEIKLKDDLLNPVLAAKTATVRFRRQTHFFDGVLNMWCENDTALAWAREAVTTVVSPIQDTTLVVKSQADAERILCKLFMPDEDNTDDKQLLRLLAAQNTSFDIHSWSIVKGERQLSEQPGVVLYLRIPKKDVETLKTQGRRLYWLMGNVFIKIVKDKSVILEAMAIKQEPTEEQESTIELESNENVLAGNTDLEIKEEVLDIISDDDDIIPVEDQGQPIEQGETPNT